METDDAKISARVKEMMDAHGVGKRGQAKELARILGISYSAATRKIKGQMPWKLEQIKEVAEHFHEPVAQLLGAAQAKECMATNGIRQDATLVIADRRFSCAAWVGSSVAGQPSTSYVGVKEGAKWLVYPTSDAPRAPAFHVERIELDGRSGELERPTIAVVDDASDIVESLCEYFNGKGLNTRPYSRLRDFEEAIDDMQFDGVVIDWLFDTETAATAIMKIRTSENPDAPIFLLTGQLVTGKADEHDITTVIQQYDVMCLEKPVRPSILLAELTKRLGLR